MEQLIPVLVYSDRFTAVWTESTDEAFIKYEVHLGSVGFTPGGSTLKATITDKSQLYTTISGLSARSKFECKVREIGTGSTDYSRNVQTCDPAEEVILQDQTMTTGHPNFGILASGSLGIGAAWDNPSLSVQAINDGNAWRPEEIISGKVSLAFADSSGARFNLNGHDRSGTDPTITQVTWGTREISQGVFAAPFSAFPEFLFAASAGGLPIELADGSVVQPFYGTPDTYYEQTDSAYTSFLGRTTDKGLTWTNYATIAVGTSEVDRFGEPRIVNLGGAVDNEHLVCVIRYDIVPVVAPLAATTYYSICESFDSGQTWGTPVASSLAQGTSLTAPGWLTYHDGVLYISYSERNTVTSNQKYYLGSKSVTPGDTEIDWSSWDTPASWTFNSGGSDPTRHGYSAIRVVGNEIWYVYFLNYSGSNSDSFTCMRKFDLATFTPIAPTKTTAEFYFVGDNYMTTSIEGASTTIYNAYSNKVFSKDGIDYYRAIADGDAVSVAAIGLTSY